MSRLRLDARFAGDVTAPVEDAVAAVPRLVGVGAVTAGAAHDVAAVDADRRGVAFAALRSPEADSGVGVAEGRRVVEVDEVALLRRLVVRVGQGQAEADPLPDFVTFENITSNAPL